MSTHEQATHEEADGDAAAEPTGEDYARAFRAPPELASPFGATNVGDRWILVLDEKGTTR